MRLRSAALLFPLALAGCVTTAPAPAPAMTPAAAMPAGMTPTALDDAALVQRYQATITPGELAGLLYTYADDYMAGRETGEPAQRFAARFLAGQYAAMGILPKGTGTGAGAYALDRYLQPFELDGDVTTGTTLTAHAPDGRAIAKTTFGTISGTDGHSYLATGSAQLIAPAPVVFGGFGVQTSLYDDVTPLADLDLAGTWLVLLSGDPVDANGRSLATETGEMSRYGRNDLAKAVALLRRGNTQHRLAGIVVVATDEASVEATAGDLAGRSQNLRLPSDGASGNGYTFPPVVVVSPSFANALMVPTGRTVEALRVEASRRPSAIRLDGFTLGVEVTKGVDRVGTENVVAYIEGSDPVLKNEVVVVSAHLDHVGDQGYGDDRIFNGADDDGSGTVTVLEIAEAFEQAKKDGHGPRRSILLLHVTGEEKGLLGSEYYADRQPLVPLANTAANLNIDMIGRYDPERGFERTDYVYILGADLISQDIADWNAAVNETTGTDIFLSDKFNSADDPNQFFRRSDHWNFGKHDIPFIFYFTGTHEDYHGVGDSPDKIDYDRMARIGRLIFGTAWEIANRTERPMVSGVGFN